MKSMAQDKKKQSARKMGAKMPREELKQGVRKRSGSEMPREELKRSTRRFGSEMSREELIEFARNYVYKPEDDEKSSGRKAGSQKEKADRPESKADGGRVKVKAGTKLVRKSDGERRGGRSENGRGGESRGRYTEKDGRSGESRGRYTVKDGIKGEKREHYAENTDKDSRGGDYKERYSGRGSRAEREDRYADKDQGRRGSSFFDPEGERFACSGDRPLRRRDLPPIDESLPQCPVSKRCGGCTFIGRSYEASLAFKRQRVEKLLAPFGKLSGIVGMEDPYHYRNKVHAVFAHVKDGKKERNYAGIYEAGTHKVVPVTRCLIENEEADAIIQDVLDLSKSFKIKIFDEDTSYGLLRHVLVRTGHVSGQIMVVLVLSSPILPGKNNFVKALLERHPGITTILLNVNGERTSMVLGERETVLYGPGYIEDELCGNRFRISSRSFYQVNSVQTEKLYRKAVEMANLTGRERVIDAYCGIGTIGITAAARAKEVIGVELNPDAVKDAIRNAKANRIGNIYFYENDAGDFLKGMAAQREKAEVIFMDPPRSGSTERFMDAAAAMSPGRIVYISCEPDTLARDLEYLKGKGYRMKEAWAYDMFPFTENVEVVSLLQRVSNTRERTITLDVDMEDYHRIKNGMGVTADATK